MKTLPKYTLQDELFVARPTKSAQHAKVAEQKLSLYKGMVPREIVIKSSGIFYHFFHWTVPIPESHCFTTQEALIKFVETQIVDVSR